MADAPSSLSPLQQALLSLECMQRRLDEPPPDIRALRPDVPEELASVLKSAMKIDPAERYMSAGQMADALTSALELLPVS